MPSSLLANTESFSSYESHQTLKALVGIAPSGATTFISELYTGNISDREIVIRSGILKQQFEDGDSVMEDKGFTIQDLLPLGVSLSIHPFLGANSQMSAEGVLSTQKVASVRIHIERAINKIKNFRTKCGLSVTCAMPMTAKRGPQGKLPDSWARFREVRNKLKATIRGARETFMRTAFSSSKPKELWRVIHRILKPSQQPIRIDPGKLNEFFASTAERTLPTKADSPESLERWKSNLPAANRPYFQLKEVTRAEVLHTLKTLRTDSSTGPEKIPVRFVKPVMDIIAGPLPAIYMLLTEREVRTGEYCSRSLITCLWTEPLRRGP